MDSTKAVAIPKKADTHIHRSAPGPPTETAPVTPSMLPGPTLIAVESRNDASGESPVFPAFSFISTDMPYLNLRIWMNPSFTVKYTPDPIRRIIASEKFPITGIFAYQPKLAGKSHKRSDTTCILAHTACMKLRTASILSLFPVSYIYSIYCIFRILYFILPELFSMNGSMRSRSLIPQCRT